MRYKNIKWENEGKIIMEKRNIRRVNSEKNIIRTDGAESQRPNKIIKSEERKIRIYGNRLGTTKDIISLWNAIEKNYISILAYEKLVKMFSDFQETINPAMQTNSILKLRPYAGREAYSFMQHFEKYNISDIVSPDDFPIITNSTFPADICKQRLYKPGL